MRPAKGKVFIVGAGPGDPGLITVKGSDALQQAEVVIYDRLINPYLLAQAPYGAEWVYAGKGPGDMAMSQEQIDNLLVAKALEGKIVVRLKGGDPFVFGRGGEEAEALANNAIPYEIVPGVTSAIAAPAYAGIPLTHRSASSSFTVITGREDSAKDFSNLPWDRLAAGETLVILMGAETLDSTVSKLQANGVPATMPTAVIQWGTDPRQRTITASLSGIVGATQAAGLGAPSVFVVGEVVRLRDHLKWFDTKPLFGKRVLVTRSRNQAGNLSRLLEQLGAQPVELPTIEIVPPLDWGPLDNTVGRMGSYAWIVFTSVNPVEMVWQRVRKADLDSRAFAGVRICAIGPATAQALRSRGLEPDFIPERYTSETLVQCLGARDLRGAKIFVPSSDIAPQELVAGLEGAGAVVDQVVAYRTMTPTDAREKARQLLSREDVDIATFSSSSTVQNLVSLLGGDAQKLLKKVTIACIGPVTARAAGRLGLRVDIVAAQSTIQGLVDSLVAGTTARPN